MRIALIALLSLGVVGGYGSAIARAAYWHHHGGGCHSRSWEGDRGQYGERGWGERGQWEESNRQAAPGPVQQVVQAPAPSAPAAQTVVVQSPPAAAAPAPVYIIVPSAGAPQQQVITVPQGAIQLPAPAAAAPPTAAPKQ